MPWAEQQRRQLLEHPLCAQTAPAIPNRLSEDTRKRMEIMTSSNDGFVIAEADLKLRGPGDIEGTKQSGIAFDLKIANLARDEQLLQYVRDVAREVIEADPECNNPYYAVVWERLRIIKRNNNWNWGAIS